MARPFLVALLFAFGANAIAEEINYAIFSAPLFFGPPKLIAEGRRLYSHDDVKTLPGPAPNIPNWHKTLEIANGFELGASVYRETEVEGFGLWIKRNGSGFSWEWFDRESPTIFRKLQGPGKVRVRFRDVRGAHELAEIEFLEDITMRLDRMWLIPFRDHRDTDQLVIRRGSIFWLAP